MAIVAHTPRGSAILGLLGLLGLLGCSVDGTFLDTDLFLCSTSTDCGPDWECVRATPYATDFCAARCDETCDGTCVRQGSTETCLRGCRILDDGTTSACPAEGYQCIRTSAQSDDGVCYPVTECNLDTDCKSGEVCLSTLTTAFGISGGGLRTDNLYCVPSPDDHATCPPRSTHTDNIFDSAPFQLCLPLCDASDTRCPPAFGCLRQLAFSSETPCLPGVYGIPCDDDTNCLLGRCIDTGDAGKFCSTTCNEAERIGLGCENISSLINGLGLRWRLECNPRAGGGVDGGLCVPRYEVGFPCTEPESEVFACAAGLSCMLLGASDVRACTKACVTDDECNQSGRWHDNFCSEALGVCMPQRRSGQGCERSEHCMSGVCAGGICQ